MIADCMGCIYATIHAGVGQLITTMGPVVEVKYFKARPLYLLRILTAPTHKHSSCTPT
jgi:hypothetical protein